MSSEITTGEFDESCRESCTELLKKTFPLSRINDLITWKLTQENGHAPLLAVARKGEDVISFISWFPWEFSYQGERFVGYQGGDAATHPSFRGKGIWHKVISFSLDRMRENRADFLLGFPNQRIFKAGLQTDFMPVSTLSYRLRLIPPFKKRIDRPVHANVVSMPLLFLSQPEKLTPIISSQYSGWRYSDGYDVIEYSENNCRAKFIVRRKKWMGIEELLLLDFQFTSMDQTFLANAFKSLDNAFSGKALFIRTFFNEESNRGKILGRFFALPISTKSRRLIVKPLTRKIPASVLFDRTSWDIMPHCIDDL